MRSALIAFAVVLVAGKAEAEPVELPPPPPPPPGAVRFDLQLAPDCKPLAVTPAAAAAPVTRAELPPEPTEPTEPGTVDCWYGYQTLLVDTGAITLIGVGADNNDSGMIVSGALAYLFGPMVVHIAHHHGGKAAGSVGIRLGAPILGALAGCGDSSAGCATGVGVGVAGAILIDALVLGHEEVRVGPSVSIAPMLGNGRTGLSISGAF